jgi:hypothetical protein
MTENLLPVLFQDKLVAKSRNGKAGQIIVKSLSGVKPNAAARLAQKLEKELSGGREDIIEKLQASGSQNQSIQRVVALMQENPRYGLARAIAEAAADVAVVMNCFGKGALELKKLETVLELYKEMPTLMKDLVKHAVDGEDACDLCYGLGEVQKKAGAKVGAVCPRCKGSGKVVTSSKHKEFAMQKVLEMTEMLPKKAPMVNVNQAVQVNNSGGMNSDLLERMSKAADEILYARPTATPPPDTSVVDAEVLANE